MAEISHIVEPVGFVEEAPAQMDTVKKIRLERLEFGKYCVSEDADSAVEEDAARGLAEHRQLGHSPLFPKDLIPLCTPAIVGVLTHETEEVPDDWTHGFLLRPVFTGAGKPYSLFCSMGKRAERPAAGFGRKYFLARYLAGREVDPYYYWQAISDEPLRGLTENKAKSLTELTMPETAPQLTALVNSFLPEAVAYLISGIPLAFTEVVAETDFFACLSVLWRALPLPLRPHLSAGWRVSNHFSGRLALTLTTSQSNLCALFTPGHGWQSLYHNCYEYGAATCVFCFVQPLLHP